MRHILFIFFVVCSPNFLFNSLNNIILLQGYPFKSHKINTLRSQIRYLYKILKELSRKEFRSKFGTNELCLSFLSDIKWGDGYEWIKCKNNKYSKGKKSI